MGRPRIVELGRQHLFLAQADEDADSAFGPDDERYHEILDGLHEGERVVMAGNFLLNAEAQFQGILKKMVEAPVYVYQSRLFVLVGRSQVVTECLSLPR